MNATAGIVVALDSALVITVVYFLNRARVAAVEALDAEIQEHLDTAARLFRTERQVEALVEAVVPLIEKSDWMTGRWGGQFNTLVAMENERNARVDKARRAIWAIPIVDDATRTTTLLAPLSDLGKTVATNTTKEQS